jgi:hypothetical protein
MEYFINFKNPKLKFKFDNKYKNLNDKLKEIDDNDIIGRADAISNYFFVSIN